MDREGDVDWSRLGWLAFGVVLAAVVGFVVLAFLGTFVTGVFLYYALRPFHTRIERYVRQPTIAATVTVLGITLPTLALVGYAGSIAVQELYRFADRTDFGSIQETLDPYADFSAAIEDPGSFLEDPGSLEPLLGSLTAVFDYLGLVGTVFLHLFVALAIAFYLLRDDQRLARVGRILTDRHDALATYVDAVDTSLQRIFFGNLLNAFITAGIGVVVYSLLNVFAPNAVSIPYPALVGVLTGIGSMIPVVGMKIIYVPVAGVLAVNAAVAGDGWGFVVAFVAASVVVVDMIPDFLLRPYVSGRSLHVGAVMIAYVLGPLLFGWYGIFLGPLVLVVLVQFYRIVLPELLAGKSVGATVVDPEGLYPTGTTAAVGDSSPPEAADGEAGGATDAGSERDERPPSGTDAGTANVASSDDTGSGEDGDSPEDEGTPQG